MEEEKVLLEAEDDIMSDDELDALDQKERDEFEARLKARRDKIAMDRKEREDKLAKEAEFKAKAEEILSSLGENPSWDDLFDALVPDSGKCDTVAGELIRAFNKMEYRWFNDGDKFNEDYGIETCGPAAHYLMNFEYEDETPFWDTIVDVDTSGIDERYDRFIEKLKEEILSYVLSHKELIGMENNKDSVSGENWEDVRDIFYEHDMIPSYDYDSEIPDNLSAHLEKGNISERDIVWEVQSWIENMGNSTNDVECNGTYVEIHGLSKSDYDDIDGNLYDWLEQFGDELTNEYGDPYEEEEEEESEEEPEEEEKTDESLKEEASDDLWSKLSDLYNEGNVYFDITSDDFLIIEDWDSLLAIEKYLKPDFEPKDKYDTSVLDELEIEYGFSDEYARCDECGKVIRTEPDSYSWTPDYFLDDYGFECGDCVRDNPEAYIAWLLENPEERANTILTKEDLEGLGFHKVGEDYESGWYDRHDSPKEILDKAIEEHPGAEFIFNISGNGQWATQFDLWMRGE